MTPVRRVVLLFVPVLVAGALVAGCGSSKDSSGSNASRTETTQQITEGAGLPAGAAAALHPKVSDFPAVKGRTLQAVANEVKPGLQAGVAGENFAPGRTNRVPLGLLDAKTSPVYGPTAIYVASGPTGVARGPYLAPGDSLVTAPRFRSKTTDRADIKVVYAADVPMPKTGRLAILAVTKKDGKLIGGATSLSVKNSPIPNVGDQAPRIHTPTATTKAGLDRIDTRIPHDDMHSVDFASVIGKKPVALIFSTPALCQSAVCGPVTDVLLSLEPKYRGRVTFIHQEIYKNNQIKDGLRPQLAAFHLQTEPWLFVMNKHGKIVARYEGVFGRAAATRALDASLK